MPIFRFIQHCKPSAHSRQYHPWQTAVVVLFISADSRSKALERRFGVLSEHRWEVLWTQEKSTLIAERVQEEGGAVWNAYQICAQRGYWIEVFPDQFMAGKDKPGMRVPRLNEAFIDQVVTAAGGRRLTDEERGYDRIRNVDYRLLDYIIELKDIQEEGLEKIERQTKLAALFEPYFPDREEILIDPSVLSESDLYTYADILGEPLKGQIKSASGQIKSSQKHLGNPELKGGLILLNSSYFSMPDRVFHDLACRYAWKDSSRIAFVVSITSNCATDGFNNWMNFRFLPASSSCPAEELLYNAFTSNLNDWMNEWGRSGFLSPEPEATAPILAPVTFVRSHKRFTYYPAGLPDAWTPDSM